MCVTPMSENMAPWVMHPSSLAPGLVGETNSSMAAAAGVWSPGNGGRPCHIQLLCAQIQRPLRDSAACLDPSHQPHRVVPRTPGTGAGTQDMFREG